jgi:hypothetical protein
MRQYPTATLCSSNATAASQSPASQARLNSAAAETSQVYIEATAAMKERTLAKTSFFNGKSQRYRPADQLPSIFECSAGENYIG